MPADMDIDFTRRNKKPRPLSEHEKEKLDEFVDAIHYSARCVCLLGPCRRVVNDNPDILTMNSSTGTCNYPSRC